MDEKGKISSRLDTLNKQYTHAVTAFGIAQTSDDRETAKELMDKLGKEIDQLQKRLKEL